MSQEEKDKKNKRAGILFSVGIHIAIILLFIFLIAWRAPNPPLPEFGIELNFGTSDAGTGEVQPETTPAEAESDDEAQPDSPEQVEEENLEDVPVEDTQEVEEATEPIEETIPEEITPVTDVPTEDPLKETEKTPVEEKPEVIEKKEEPKAPKVLYPGKKDGAAGTTEDANNPANANQGDKTDDLGDQGAEDGNVDARALYGKSGGGGGAALEMTGWMWDSTPDPKENTDQSGKIVFEVIIDDRGEVTSAKPIIYTVSASLVRIYQAEVERLSFSKTSSGPVPSSTKGKITFIIKAK